MVSVPACVFRTCDRHPSSFHIYFSLYPNMFPVVSQWMWFALGSTVIEYFLVSKHIS